MTALITHTALAYVNHGRWIADCPRPYCNNAFGLEPRQPIFRCAGMGGCQVVASIQWPSDADEIIEALSKRPVPGTRNWFPHGHDLAVRFGYPMGQSPKDLIEEQEEMERLAGQ
jgi:hypothetical protein